MCCTVLCKFLKLLWKNVKNLHILKGFFFLEKILFLLCFFYCAVLCCAVHQKVYCVHLWSGRVTARLYRSLNLQNVIACSPCLGSTLRVTWVSRYIKTKYRASSKRRSLGIYGRVLPCPVFFRFINPVFHYALIYFSRLILKHIFSSKRYSFLSMRRKTRTFQVFNDSILKLNSQTKKKHCLWTQYFFLRRPNEGILSLWQSNLNIPFFITTAV